MMLRVSAVLAALLLAPVSAFTAPPSATRTATLRLPSTVVMAATMPNPLSKLPWNVKREAERAARRMKQERNTLHRQLGIAEDATYEEIVTATDGLIAKAAGNLKEKVKIEVAKDQILQIRLNERLAGLTLTTKEARAQSRFETAGYVRYHTVSRTTVRRHGRDRRIVVVVLIVLFSQLFCTYLSSLFRSIA
jgi:hypothetical protein